jgi:hypothetical protein
VNSGTTAPSVSGQDVRGAGAERHPDAYLACARARRLRRDRVHAHRREDERQHAEHCQ